MKLGKLKPLDREAAKTATTILGVSLGGTGLVAGLAFLLTYNLGLWGLIPLSIIMIPVMWVAIYRSERR